MCRVCVRKEAEAEAAAALERAARAEAETARESAAREKTEAAEAEAAKAEKRYANWKLAYLNFIHSTGVLIHALQKKFLVTLTRSFKDISCRNFALF